METRRSTLIPRCRLLFKMAEPKALETLRQTIEPEIDNRSGVQGQELANEQSANDRDSQGMTQLRAGARSERQRQPAEERRHRRHHDWAKTQERSLIDGLFCRLVFV